MDTAIGVYDRFVKQRTGSFGITALVLLVATAVGNYGCGREEPRQTAIAPKTSAEETVTVKIGTAGPLTGGIAHLGKDNENGVRLAIDEANAKKLKIGGKVVKFELQSEDDQGDPKLGPTIAQKFVDAKVAGVVGHLNSGVSIPASAVYNSAQLPMISASATNPKLTEQGFNVIFRTVGRDDQQGPAVAAYVANELKSKKVAIADDGTAYGEGLADEVEKTLKAAGVQVVAREKTNDKATDFKAILTKIKGRKPDAIFYGGMDATGGPLLKQARELGITSTFVYGDGACTDEMAKLAGAAAEGFVCTQAGTAIPIASKEFRDAFKGKYGDFRQYAPYAYDSTNLMIAAMQKADSIDPAKYLPEMRKSSYDGATGRIEFDSKGDRKDPGITIFKMKSGKVVPVEVIAGGKPASYPIQAFPWPPPKASTFVVVPRTLLERPNYPVRTIGDIDRRLSQALNQGGYSEISYFVVSGGFAMVTRLEQIMDDGKPMQGDARWATEPAPLREFSLAKYIAALFSTKPGRFRIIVFVVTPVSFSQAQTTVDRAEAMEWLTAGNIKLPPEIAKQMYTEQVSCTALVYEFEKLKADKSAAQSLPSKITAQQHLVGAALWAALER